MQKKLKNILINLGLLGVVFFIMLLFHAVFIAGPFRAQEYEEKLFVDAFAERYQLSNVELMNRFALDEIYYVVSADSSLYAFNSSYTKVYKHDFVDKNKVVDLATNMGFKDTDIKYGVFADEIVFSLEKSSRVVMVDLVSLEIVFE